MPEKVAAGSSVAFSIASPYGTYQGLAALRESGGLGVPITDEGIFEAQRALAGEEGIYAEPSAIVGLTAVMQLARQKAIAPDQVVVVVLTSGGLKDYGASRAWLPAVPSAGPDFDSTLRILEDSYGLGLGAVASAWRSWARTRPPASSSAPAPPRRAGFGSLWFIEDYFQTGAFALAGAAAAVTARIAIGSAVVNPLHAPPGADRDGDGDAGRHRAGTRRARARHGRPAMDRGPDGDPGAARRSPRSRECVDVVRRLLGRRARDRTRARASRSPTSRSSTSRPSPSCPSSSASRDRGRSALAGAVADGVRVLDHVLARPRAPRARDDRAGAPAAGRGPSPSLAYVPVADRPRRRPPRADRVRPLLARYLAHLHGQTILAEAGVSEAQTLAIRAARARGETGAALVTEEQIDAFALAGSPDHARAAARAPGSRRASTRPSPCPSARPTRSEQLGLIGAELLPSLVARP